MHPPLSTPQRQLVCGDFIQALQDCHDSAWWKRYTGACNEQDRALKVCLRKERIERTRRNAEASKSRQLALSHARASWEDD